jgi:type I restriction enzyme, S subunit
MTDKNGELPKGWKWVKLGDVCELQNGYAFKSNTFTKQGVPVIKMGNIGKDFRLRWEPSTLSYLPEEFLKIYESFVVAKNDLLITLTDMSPSGEYLGTVALYTQEIPALLNQRVGRFYKISEQLDSFYLYFCLCSGDFRKYATYDDTGNLQKNTNPEYLYKFQLPLPPLPEQKRIVAILNEQMAAVEKAHAAAEAQLQAAKTLPAAYLRDVFDSPEAQKWERKPIGEITQLRSGGTPSRNNPSSFVGTIPWVKTLDLNCGWVITTEEFISSSAFSEIRGELLPIGTVMVAMYGGSGTIGKSGILGLPATTNQALCSILPNSNTFVPEFLHSWLVLIRPEWMKHSGGNRRDPNINKG